MPKPNLRFLLQMIILSILVGAGSGVLATAITTNYLSDYALQLGELTAPLRFAETRPKNLPLTYSEAVAHVRDAVLPTVAEFHPLKEGTFAGYPSEGASFYGVVLTSDGWIAAVPPGSIDPARLAVVVARGAYRIEASSLDQTTGVLFVKVNAGNLPVVAFGDSYALSPGDDLYAAGGRDAVIATSLVASSYGMESVRSSDQPARRLILRETVPSGLPVANLSGDLVALSLAPADDRGRALPLEAMLPAFRSLLSDGKIIRPTLGVSFIDLSQTAGLSDEARRGHAQGALLAAGKATAATSGALKAGLKAGDIILSIDGQGVTSGKSLDDRLLEYKAGDTISVGYDRAGEISEVSVVLGGM